MAEILQSNLHGGNLWWNVLETNAGVRNTGRRSTYVIPGVTRFGMFQKLTPTYVIPGVN